MTTNPLNSTWSFTPKDPKQINSVAINDDGSRCAFGSSYERGTGNFYTYLFDGTGTELWKKPIPTQNAYQGVFWVAISGDGSYVASGGESVMTKPTANASEETSNATPGFLQAYDAASGTSLLDELLASRINQVSLSQNGQFLAACYGKTIVVYGLNADATKYVQIYKQEVTDYNINSCVISRDGSTLVASGIKYSSTGATEGQSTPSTNASDSTSGVVLSFTVTATAVTPLGSYTKDTGFMRVAVDDSGDYWAASLHDGSCMLFNGNDPSKHEWHCTPEKSNLMLAYAVDITRTDSGDIYVACGANLWGDGDGGFLYLVKSTRMVYDENNLEYPDPIFTGVVQWSTDIKYGVNPGVSMDKNATYVTATDGKPKGQTVQESQGSFYLFSAAGGQRIWKHNTDMMNWPMMLARDGLSVIGGSDEGSVYYWKAPYVE